MMNHELSVREVEILFLVASGYKDREIGFILSLEIGSVKSHLQNIYKKLQALNRTNAVVKAHREGYFNIRRCTRV